MHKKYLAEFIGTFTLALAVYLAAGLGMGSAVPLLAAVVVGLFVYTVGGISGAHFNPAVTLGALSVGTISRRDAGVYIVVQLVGAALAMVLGATVAGEMGVVPSATFALPTALAEALGAFLLTFGIASVVYRRAHESASGIVIGASLFVGILLASMTGSMGILNPAVALALGSLDLSYLVGPVLGAALGFWTYRSLA